MPWFLHILERRKKRIRRRRVQDFLDIEGRHKKGHLLRGKGETLRKSSLSIVAKNPSPLRVISWFLEVKTLGRWLSGTWGLPWLLPLFQCSRGWGSWIPTSSFLTSLRCSHVILLSFPCASALSSRRFMNGFTRGTRRQLDPCLY